jgi:hypothetical protein
MTRFGKTLTFCILGLGTAGLSTAQSSVERQPCPDLTAEATGCELIAWSQLQEPAPLPLMPSADEHERQERISNGASQLGSLQTVTGVVGKSHGQYWLKVNTEEELLIGNWETARLYEGRRVQIIGSLDAALKTLKVESIMPLL